MELLLFTRYLSTLITAGLPVSQALELIGREQENPVTQSRLAKMRKMMDGGETLGVAISQFPQSFDEFYCKVIKAGEQAGTLEKVLNRLADYLDKTESLRRKIKKAITYPSIVLTVTLGVSLMLLLFVAPPIQALYHSPSSELPFLTRIFFDFSHFLRTSFFKGLLLGCLSLLAFGLAFKIFKSVRKMVDAIMLTMLGMGQLFKKSIASRYARALAISLDAGVPLGDALRSMENLVANLVYRKTIRRIGKEVRGGKPLSISMSRNSLFPDMVVQMVSTGETSAALPEMLNKVADYYEEEVNSIIEYYGRLLEPLMILLLGGIIGTFAIAMYLPLLTA